MIRRLTLAVAMASLIASSAFAAKAPTVAQATARGGAVDWTVTAGAHRLVLTVSQPDGVVVRQELAGGETPTFGTLDAKGNARPEGVYHWELRLVPEVSAEVQKRLAAARSRGDEAAARRIQQANGLDRPLVQTGAFSLRGGTFVDSETREERPAVTAEAGIGVITAADQVIPDDLIVQGSTCVGLDCVNNENFGFDTIRLKENNLRIHFDDTSTTAGFPANDWRLIANDSASGGSSKFSIEDSTGAKTPFTIIAGASTNSIFVDSSGRVGLRTSTPVLDLHVSTSNTPALRLEQNNSGGFTAQTWDIGANEANFFVRDVTGGSRLSFRIRPGAPTSSLDISADGDVGIGTASPDSKLHVLSSATGPNNIGLHVENTNGTGSARRLIDLENNGQVQFRMKDTAQTPDWQFTASNAFQIDNTADPGVELQVNPDGALLVNGTQMTVPDYVFEPDYSLMPLDELAEFVAKNRHLPNVPGAAEINSGGLNLSAFPLQLLEKVEELTLYTIQQDEKIGHLTSENARLEERLRALEAKLQGEGAN